MATTYSVVDLSKYNTISNYANAASAVNGVLIRCGYSGSSTGAKVTDTKFLTHYNSMFGKPSSNGTPIKLGVYWFSQAITTAEAVAEADYVYNLIKDKEIDFPVYIDSEYANSSHSGRADSLNSTERTNIIVAFCEEIKSLGYRAGVYASDSWFANNLKLSTLYSYGYSLWVARYSTNAPVNVSGYDGWQYTSSGSISGASGNVDLSTFYKDVANWGGGSTTPGDISAMTVELSYYTIEYSGNKNYPTIYLGGLTIGTDFTVEYLNNLNVGTATINITAINGYTGTNSATFTITPQDISSKIMYANPARCPYTPGGAQPSCTIQGLSRGDDFTVTYEDNLDTGIATAIATGINNYTGTTTCTFQIYPGTIEGLGIYLDTYEYKYTGGEIKPTVYISGLEEDVDFTVSYENNIDAGTAKAIATGIGNYTDTTYVEFQITTMSIADKNVSISTTSYVYDGKAKTPIVTVEGLQEGTDFEVIYTNNINNGTGYATARGINSYSGEKTVTFTISRLNIGNMSISLDTDTYYYTSAEIKPTVHVEQLDPTSDFYVVYKNNIEIGKASAIAYGSGNYTGVLSIPFNIEARNMQDCIAKVGTPSIKTIFRIDGPLVIYADDTLSTVLIEETHYHINEFRDHINFKVIPSEPTGEIDTTDDGIYNFGDIDLEDETATGNYDFDDLDEGLTPDSVAEGYYDSNNPGYVPSTGDSDDDEESTVIVITNDDDYVFNFGDLDNYGETEAEGDYNFGELEDAGIAKSSVAVDDYDFNFLCDDNNLVPEEYHPAPPKIVDNSYYDLEFVKSPIKESYDNYLREAIYHNDYYSVTEQDKYWVGEGRTELKVNWVEPTFVGAKESKDIVIHKV